MLIDNCHDAYKIDVLKKNDILYYFFYIKPNSQFISVPFFQQGLQI